MATAGPGSVGDSFAWPVFRSVGIGGLIGNGNGQLIIAPGLLVAKPGRLARALLDLSEVVHESDEVDIHVTRLIPAWCNVAIPVRGANRQLVAYMWRPALPKITKILTLAGFAVRKHVTMMDRGIRWPAQ